MSKSFNNLYNDINSKYAATAKELQADHKKSVSKVRLIFIIVYIPILIILITKFTNIIPVIFISLWYFIFSTILTILFTSKTSSKATNYYKENVVNDIVDGVFPGGEYFPGKGISRQLYNSRAFLDNYDRYSSSDLIQTNNKYNLIFSDVHTEDETTDDDGNTRYVTSFLGTAGVCDISKHIGANILIVYNRFLGAKNKANVKVDMPEFEKNFDVYSDNKIVAMQLLTADVMADILELKNKYKSMIEIAIENDKIYFRIHNGNNFEIKSYKNIMNIENMRKHYETLILIEKITSKINGYISELDV